MTFDVGERQRYSLVLQNFFEVREGTLIYQTHGLVWGGEAIHEFNNVLVLELPKKLDFPYGCEVDSFLGTLRLDFLNGYDSPCPLLLGLFCETWKDRHEMSAELQALRLAPSLGSASLPRLRQFVTCHVYDSPGPLSEGFDDLIVIHDIDR